ncbi:3-oxoacyl-reductase [Desarmillaria tabescens]|uniref:3-oxoacyl-reductase n=1 Tax=Armillaria tabescens TaxID=1929756 RepID=A0AA39NK54_ARMTA|nr:3-oxoacyl-reductase [Desarmillaria tabescens]KAK0467029.1 3-oxoacyl-reductase [Desarmillaria tabescens]
MQLQSKRIIVTGGAQGIGEAIVRAYAAEGATVTSVDVNDQLGLVVAQEVTSEGLGTVTYAHLDISDRTQVYAVFKEAAAKMGGLDVLVNNAGIHRHVPAHDVSPDVLERIFKVNVFGTIYTNDAAYAIMREQGGGAIINFGSEAGLTSEVNNAVYGSSKGAVHTWTRSVAREWGPAGVRVNAVLPYVVTPMYKQYIEAMVPEQRAAHDKLLKEQFPLGSIGDTAKDLAPVMVFLASDASHFMTGQLFPVDGGYASVR